MEARRQLVSQTVVFLNFRPTDAKRRLACLALRCVTFVGLALTLELASDHAAAQNWQRNAVPARAQVQRGQRALPRLLGGNLSRGFEPVVTENFVVTAPDPGFAQKVASEAERFRRELSNLWLGYEIEPWSERCPIEVRFERAAGGRTSFLVDGQRRQSEPTQWEMEIYGPPERILDSVLPHEVTHTIFASHFRRPLPRWADEGACTSVEHISERQKNHEMLMDILSARPSRGIPFNRMFMMYRYPEDLYPLYAQGYSLARFLLLMGDERQFIRYIETGLAYEDQGMELEGWNRATAEVYGVPDLGELQLKWLGWIKRGCPSESMVANRSSAQPDTQVLANTEDVYLNPEKIRATPVSTHAGSPGNLSEPTGTLGVNSQHSAPDPLATIQRELVQSDLIQHNLAELEAVRVQVPDFSIDYRPGSLSQSTLDERKLPAASGLTRDSSEPSFQPRIHQADVQFRARPIPTAPGQVRSRPTLYR